MYTTETFNKMKNDLLNDLEILNSWFYENYMILNPQKCDFMYLGKSKFDQEITYNNTKLDSTSSKDLLGVTIDQNLDFNAHINNICKKAGRKLNALSRLSMQLTDRQKLLLFNSFIQGQFNYCPLIWMFCTRTANRKINKLHERSLRLCYNNYNSTFDNLLKINNGLKIHSKNIHKLVLEIYKNLNGLAPPIVKDIFTVINNHYNLRNFRELKCQNIKTLKHGLNTVSYKGPQLWQLVPESIKLSKTSTIFKDRIKSWIIPKCSCNL